MRRGRRRRRLGVQVGMGTGEVVRKAGSAVLLVLAGGVVLVGMVVGVAVRRV